MLTRRDFIRAVAAGSVAEAGSSGVSAAQYELLLQGGRVIDPASGVDRIMDVAIVA